MMSRRNLIEVPVAVQWVLRGGRRCLAPLLFALRIYMGAEPVGVPHARAVLGASLKRRRYKPTSSVNVRPQP